MRPPKKVLISCLVLSVFSLSACDDVGDGLGFISVQELSMAPVSTSWSEPEPTMTTSGPFVVIITGSDSGYIIPESQISTFMGTPETGYIMPPTANTSQTAFTVASNESGIVESVNNPTPANTVTNPVVTEPLTIDIGAAAAETGTIAQPPAETSLPETGSVTPPSSTPVSPSENSSVSPTPSTQVTNENPTPEIVAPPSTEPTASESIPAPPTTPITETGAVQPVNSNQDDNSASPSPEESQENSEVAYSDICTDTQNRSETFHIRLNSIEAKPHQLSMDQAKFPILAIEAHVPGELMDRNPRSANKNYLAAIGPAFYQLFQKDITVPLKTIDLKEVDLLAPKAKSKSEYSVNYSSLNFSGFQKKLARSGWWKIWITFLVCDDTNGDNRCSDEEIENQLISHAPMFQACHLPDSVIINVIAEDAK